MEQMCVVTRNFILAGTWTTSLIETAGLFHALQARSFYFDHINAQLDCIPTCGHIHMLDIQLSKMPSDRSISPQLCDCNLHHALHYTLCGSIALNEGRRKPKSAHAFWKRTLLADMQGARLLVYPLHSIHAQANSSPDC